MLAALAAFYSAIALLLVLLRWSEPSFTAVQAERRVASWTEASPYVKRYAYLPLASISPDLQHAVIAAEDARFFKHHGLDWTEIGSAVEQGIEGGRTRGASTITQQLVRNLFLSTGRSPLRKAIEFSIVPLTEAILSKQRILELYLNVIEWGRGIYGAQAASQAYFAVHANRLTYTQAIELASILPAPLHRKPDRITPYGKRIAQRMHELGY